MDEAMNITTNLPKVKKCRPSRITQVFEDQLGYGIASQNSAMMSNKPEDLANSYILYNGQNAS